MSMPFSVGDTATHTSTVTAAMVEAFADLSGDRNPLHLDEAYAEKTRFGARISHGFLVGSFISTVIGMHLPGNGAIYLSQSLRFEAPVYLGDTITTTGTVTKVREDKPIITLETICRNQDDAVVISGEAVVLYEPVPED
jgi:3-hydroxybutyryl-CoA dehydratase